jgi:hypothetical protein
MDGADRDDGSSVRLIKTTEILSTKVAMLFEEQSSLMLTKEDTTSMMAKEDLSLFDTVEFVVSYYEHRNRLTDRSSSTIIAKILQSKRRRRGEKENDK